MADINKENPPVVEDNKGDENNQQKQPKTVNVKTIIDAYPHDRESVRDHLLLALVDEVAKIGTLLDWFAKRKQEEIDKTIKLKE